VADLLLVDRHCTWRLPHVIRSLLSFANFSLVMSALERCIPGDPDISGIGVRLAIYIQNLLSFIPAVWALWDGEVSVYELESVETQSTTVLITAFAILISAMVQARTLGLSNFHASIVLDLSWMNNSNTFIYFLLYLQHKSQPGKEAIEPEWSVWIRHVRDLIPLRSAVARRPDAEAGQSKIHSFKIKVFH
jgi:hypothetical protein